MEKVEQWSKQNITQTFFCNEFVGERDRIIKAEGMGVCVVFITSHP